MELLKGMGMQKKTAPKATEPAPGNGQAARQRRVQAEIALREARDRQEELRAFGVVPAAKDLREARARIADCEDELASAEAALRGLAIVGQRQREETRRRAAIEALAQVWRSFDGLDEAWAALVKRAVLFEAALAELRKGGHRVPPAGHPAFAAEARRVWRQVAAANLDGFQRELDGGPDAA